MQSSDQFELTKSVKVWVLNPYFIRNVIKSSLEKNAPLTDKKGVALLEKGAKTRKKNQMGRFSFFLF